MSSTIFPRSKKIFCDVLNSETWVVMSLIYVQVIPVLVGSAVDVRNTSTSPRYMRANLSNCLPADVTVKLMVIRLKSHGAELYWPVFLAISGALLKHPMESLAYEGLSIRRGEYVGHQILLASSG